MLRLYRLLMEFRRFRGGVLQADLVQMIVVPDPTAVSDQCTVFRIAALDTGLVRTKTRSVNNVNIPFTNSEPSSECAFESTENTTVKTLGHRNRVN